MDEMKDTIGERAKAAQWRRSRAVQGDRASETRVSRPHPRPPEDSAERPGRGNRCQGPEEGTRAPKGRELQHGQH